jgi:hypothetical protein
MKEEKKKKRKRKRFQKDKCFKSSVLSMLKKKEKNLTSRICAVSGLERSSRIVCNDRS